MTRPRKNKNRGLPLNLYHEGKYFKYRHPITGRKHGMGLNKADAIRMAKQLNSILVRTTDLTTRILGVPTLKSHIEWMRKEILPEREYAAATLEMYDIRFRQLERSLGEKAIDTISVKDINDLREPMTPRPSNQIRQVSVDVFSTAMSRGICSENPAEATLKRKEKKKRLRLNLDQYTEIYQEAPRWLQNAMDLALITLQRREDIVSMQFDNFDGQHLFVIQKKTQKYDTGYLKINASTTLKDLINQCKNDDIESPYIIHRPQKKLLKRKDGKHWSYITPEMISREFKKKLVSLKA